MIIKGSIGGIENISMPERYGLILRNCKNGVKYLLPCYIPPINKSAFYIKPPKEDIWVYTFVHPYEGLYRSMKSSDEDIEIKLLAYKSSHIHPCTDLTDIITNVVTSNVSELYPEFNTIDSILDAFVGDITILSTDRYYTVLVYVDYNLLKLKTSDK